MILENKFLYFLRKERGVPSTWGENACFLDLLEKEDHHVGHTYQTHVGWNSDKQLYLDAHFKNIGAQQSPDFHTVANYLCHHFSREEEYGLLNRLDTETSGFLYFAKNHEFYEAYRGQQKAGKIVKH